MRSADYTYINDDNYTDYIENVPNTVKEDLTSKVYGEWEVKGYFGNKLWLCRCSCGTYRAINRYTLVNNKSKSCGHKLFNNLSNTQIGDWYVIRYIGNQHYECRCSCGEVRSVHTYSLTSGKSKSCGHNKSIDKYKGNTYWDWKILDYCGNNKYKCECSCGNVREVDISDILSGRSKSCGHNSNAFKDIKDLVFGELRAIEYIGNGKWKCECSCGNILEVDGSALRLGRVTSCGHTNNRVKDIKDQVFGKWTVLEYVGNMLWRCRCECGTVSNIYGHALRAGRTKSCLKCSHKRSKETLLSRYGDITPTKINNPRESWQIEVLSSKETLMEFILSLGERPTINELKQILNINKSNTLDYIHKYGLEDFVIIGSTQSSFESELIDYISSIYTGEIVHGDTKVLDGLELDIYIPGLKLAFEFNGDYWHSDEMKDKHYHQNKTISCAKQGIHLVHIFEYEWLDDGKRNKLLKYIKKLLCNNVKVVYARKTIVQSIARDTAKEFIDKYHLQSYVHSNINIGMYYDNELISVISFGKPRFNAWYQYEIIRYCNRDDIVIVGGLEKMFKYFVNNYNPESIVTYSDLAKFNGNCYLKVGFKTSIDMITEPNYVWVSSDKKEVLSRYQTQKHKLLEQGLGDLGNTESEIMKELKFLRVYDSGNLRLEWRNVDDTII